MKRYYPLLTTWAVVFCLGGLMSPAFGQWNTEVADNSSGEVGKGSSLCVDSERKPQIAYHDFNLDVHKQTYKNGTWQGPYGYGSIGYGTNCPLIAISKVPGNDTFHVANVRYLGSDCYVYVYLKDGRTGSWTGNTVASQEPDASGGQVGVDIASTGRLDLQVIYTLYNYGSPLLHYKKMTGGTWASEETVSSIAEEEAGWQFSICIDGSGYPHVAFLTNGQVRYRRKTAGGWQPVEIVTSNGGARADMVIDGSSYPHICFCDASGSIRYYYKDAGGWHDGGVVGAGGGWNQYSGSIAGHNGKYYIAYCDNSGTLKFAWQTTRGWTSHNVESGLGSGDGGHYESLAIDADGGGHIAYYDITNQVLKYAYHADIVGIEEKESDIRQMASGISMKVYPNPFRSYCCITLYSRNCSVALYGRNLRGQAPTLKIYDATGRLIKDLLPTSNFSLPTFLIWDGTDDFGQRLPSGIYFLYFVTGDYKQVEKAILLR